MKKRVSGHTASHSFVAVEGTAQCGSGDKPNITQSGAVLLRPNQLKIAPSYGRSVQIQSDVDTFEQLQHSPFYPVSAHGIDQADNIARRRLPNTLIEMGGRLKRNVSLNFWGMKQHCQLVRYSSFHDWQAQPLHNLPKP